LHFSCYALSFINFREIVYYMPAAEPRKRGRPRSRFYLSPELRGSAAHQRKIALKNAMDALLKQHKLGRDEVQKLDPSSRRKYETYLREYLDLQRKTD